MPVPMSLVQVGVTLLTGIAPDKGSRRVVQAWFAHRSRGPCSPEGRWVPRDPGRAGKGPVLREGQLAPSLSPWRSCNQGRRQQDDQ